MNYLRKKLFAILSTSNIKDNDDLPRGYKKVAYLTTQNATNLYIDTGLYIKDGYQVELMGRFEPELKYSSYFIGGSKTEAGTYMIGRNYSKLRMVVGSNVGSTRVEIDFDNNWHKYEVKLNGYFLDDIFYPSSKPNFTTLKANAVETERFLLFHAINRDTTAYKQIAYIKFWDLDGNLVRDYIPCLDEKGIPCMYDLVNKTTNYKADEASGEFGYSEEMI